jgi:hypothetical protein
MGGGDLAVLPSSRVGGHPEGGEQVTAGRTSCRRSPAGCASSAIILAGPCCRFAAVIRRSREQAESDVTDGMFVSEANRRATSARPGIPAEPEPDQ